MDTTVDRLFICMMAVMTATGAALTLAYIARYNFGLSRQEIRSDALVAAAFIAALVAADFFDRQLRKPQ
jgi:hypothetical protein